VRPGPDVGDCGLGRVGPARELQHLAYASAHPWRDVAMARHAAAEQRLVEHLEPGEREQLAGLLRKLLLSVDR